MINDSYDCSPKPLPEKFTSHVSRVVHNVFHPHHQQHYIAPMVLMCKLPDMETVTITAGADQPPNFDIPGPNSPEYFGSDGYSGYGSLYVPEFSIAPSKPVSVPEPSSLILLFPALVIMFLIVKLKTRRA